MNGERKRTAWARLVGPLTGAQSAAVLAVAAAGAAAIGKHTARRTAVGRGVLLAVVAFDLIGGLVAFQLTPTREQYRKTSLRSRLVFTGVHLQPFVLPAVGQGTWKRAALRYAAAVASTVALETALPRAGSRRIVANLLAASLSVADVATDDSQQRWFGPVYLMKVIGGHAGIRQS